MVGREICLSPSTRSTGEGRRENPDGTNTQSMFEKSGHYCHGRPGQTGEILAAEIVREMQNLRTCVSDLLCRLNVLDPVSIWIALGKKW